MREFILQDFGSNYICTIYNKRNSIMIKQAMILFVFILFILSFATGGCKSSSNPTTPPAQTPNTISIQNFTFSPAIDTISTGTTITWKNNDGVAHTSTSNTGVWNTGNIVPRGSATTTFNTVGTFPYHCAIHSSMMGTIVVK